jgi:hypothetical protein
MTPTEIEALGDEPVGYRLATDEENEQAERELIEMAALAARVALARAGGELWKQCTTVA